VLLEPGVTLTTDVIGRLERAGIDRIFRPEPGEDTASFVLAARNLVMPANSLKIGMKVDRPIFDSAGRLLVEAGTTVTDRLGVSLERRGISQIYVRRSPEEMRIAEVLAFRGTARQEQAVRPQPFAEQFDRARLIKPEDCIVRKIDELLAALGDMSVPKVSEPMLDALRRANPLQPRPQSAKDGMLLMYDEAVACTTAIFKALQRNADVQEEQVGQMARNVVGGLIEEQNLLLNLNNVPAAQGYLPAHSLSVAMLSITTATARGHDRTAVLELAYAGYLHDIGMLRLPPEVLEKPGRLDQTEMLQVRRHTAYSLDMLQRLTGRRSGIPLMVPIVTYQSHERENGSGYPKGRKGRLIHEFAKVVGVCDAYQAMTCRRPWRQAMLPYQAMEQIVLMGARREFDPEIVRSMLSCVSLFPIGSWVEMSDGSRARVVGLASSNYTKPVVSIMERNGQRLRTPERVNLAEHRDVQVVRPLPVPDNLVSVMEGF